MGLSLTCYYIDLPDWWAPLIALLGASACGATAPRATHADPAGAQVRRDDVDRAIVPFIDPEKKRLGFRTRAGEVLIAPAYEGVGYFSEGVAPVRIGELWGYVDKQGQPVLAARASVSPQREPAAGYPRRADVS